MIEPCLLGSWSLHVDTEAGRLWIRGGLPLQAIPAVMRLAALHCKRRRGDKLIVDGLVAQKIGAMLAIRRASDDWRGELGIEV